MRLNALNHCKNNQNFLFIIIITRIFQGFSKKKMYFCIRNCKLAQGKLAFKMPGSCISQHFLSISQRFSALSIE